MPKHMPEIEARGGEAEGQPGNPAPAAEELPLATFALFTYNQEEYVREAVEGALAQDYPNLEIIISDDASTDGTWDAIGEITSNYTGPHKIHLNRNTKNAGWIAHINHVNTLVSADYVVFAAGDDISRCDRVTQCMGSFKKSQRIRAVFADIARVDTKGLEIQNNKCIWPNGSPVSLESIMLGAGGVGIGASYAYKKECFDWPWAIPLTLISEDKILPLRAFLLGGISHIPEPLVKYRTSETSLTNHLFSAGLRPGGRMDHLAELRRTLEHANATGKISSYELKCSLDILKGLPVTNYVDNVTRKWAHPTRKVALFLTGNLVNWRTIHRRVLKKIYGLF